MWGYNSRFKSQKNGHWPEDLWRRKKLVDFRVRWRLVRQTAFLVDDDGMENEPQFSVERVLCMTNMFSTSLARFWVFVFFFFFFFFVFRPLHKLLELK